MDDLLAMEQEIDLEVKALETCAYNSTTFKEILTKIQKAVDNLSLHSFSNLPQWVAKLDEEVRHDIHLHFACWLFCKFLFCRLLMFLVRIL